MNRHVITYPTAAMLSEATADRILLELGDCLAVQDRVNVALTGGTDANDIYSMMQASILSKSVDWERVHLWWSDERFVPPEDEDRNAGQARDAWFGSLIQQGLLPKSNVHEMPVDLREPQQIQEASDADNDRALLLAAQAYNKELVNELGEEPSFDLAIFGVGPDGHFASLFPDHGEAELDDPQINVVGVSHSPKLPPLRMSLTVPCIRRTRKVWIFTSTTQKANAVRAALSVHDDPHVPSSYGQGREETLWLLDRDAASLLQ
ncbi:6-phosphogluconolactonase [Bombiscardovia coagulans]|uniref:6-phosphogluconolactonase n=1 Tax=Bombiscardovia coagulans TaxID=686666 RepID=A0A261EU79_9BIFI|nr:6-phosphogluconolactonase [Bombiscardovia coagulans]OZG50385.1 6-phosphogluconolactonase [Bombiscardovia coagulans]